ncbi:hypothetical protein nbrc107696_44550 [Gordonia spumicola]|uniref:YbaB/EbfC DNA-binding family protein n=2 Tax=Gordonia spumicola TaxID=589161 RepID=A0A7I9VF53_9ACTN|nr:hypothetical protein nbrc107696_44550 [Gordonia spumicola]
MDDVQHRAELQLQALEGVQARLNALTVTETGDSGRVIVDVDVTGAMTGLRLLPGAGNGQPAALADQIVRTAVRAATRVFTDRADIMTAFVADFAELIGSDAVGVSMEPDPGFVRPTLQEPQSEE